MLVHRQQDAGKETVTPVYLKATFLTLYSNTTGISLFFWTGALYTLHTWKRQREEVPVCLRKPRWGDGLCSHQPAHTSKSSISAYMVQTLIHVLILNKSFKWSTLFFQKSAKEEWNLSFKDDLFSCHSTITRSNFNLCMNLNFPDKAKNKK